MEFKTRSTSFTPVVSVCYVCMCAGFLVFLVHRALQRISWHFSQRFLNVSVFLSVGTPWRLCPLPCPSLSFHCFISVTGACFFSFRTVAHGWVAWICHGSVLHLEAGCQQWKFLGVSDTQPPLCEAVVNLNILMSIQLCIKV